jgi:O-antigen ligase
MSFTLLAKGILLRTLSLFGWILFSGMLFLTDSGTGWLAALAGMVFILVYWRPWTVSIIAPVAGLAVSIGIAVYGKVQWLSQSLSMASLLDRFDICTKTIKLLKGYRVLTGLGLGNWYIETTANYSPRTLLLHAHNGYLQLYADAGVLGIIAMVIAYIYYVKISVRVLSTAKRNAWYAFFVGMNGAIIAGAVFAFFDVTMVGPLLNSSGYVYLSMPLLWLWSALYVVAAKRLQTNKLPTTLRSWD